MTVHVHFRIHVFTISYPSTLILRNNMYLHVCGHVYNRVLAFFCFMAKLVLAFYWQAMFFQFFVKP